MYHFNSFINGDLFSSLVAEYTSRIKVLLEHCQSNRQVCFHAALFLLHNTTERGQTVFETVFESCQSCL